MRDIILYRWRMLHRFNKDRQLRCNTFLMLDYNKYLYNKTTREETFIFCVYSQALNMINMHFDEMSCKKCLHNIYEKVFGTLLNTGYMLNLNEMWKKSFSNFLLLQTLKIKPKMRISSAIKIENKEQSKILRMRLWSYVYSKSTKISNKH